MDKEEINPVYRKEKVWTVEELCSIFGFKYENGFVRERLAGSDMNVKRMWKGYEIGKMLIPNFEDTSFLFKLVFLANVIFRITWEGGVKGPRNVCENKILSDLYCSIFNPYTTLFRKYESMGNRTKPIGFCQARCGHFVLKRKKIADMEALRFVEERVDFLDGRPVRKIHVIDTIIENPARWVEQHTDKETSQMIDWITWKLKK